MIMRLRLGSSDDDGADNGGSRDDAEDETRTWTQVLLNPPDSGGVFIRATLAFAATTALSMIAMVVVLLGAAEEPFVDQPTVENPITGWIWLLSLAGTAVSVFGYTAWSFWKQRRRKEQLANHGDSSLFEKPIRTLQIATADSGELDEYERRVQKTVFGFVTGVFVGYLPIRIALDAVLSL